MLDGLPNLILALGQNVDQEQCLKMLVQAYLSKREVADPAVFLLDLKQTPVDFYQDYFTLVQFEHLEKLTEALVNEINLGKFTENQKHQLLSCGRFWMRFNPDTKQWSGLDVVPSQLRWNFFIDQSLAQSISDAYQNSPTALAAMHSIVCLIQWLPPHHLYPFITQTLSGKLAGLDGIKITLPVYDLFTRWFLATHFSDRNEHPSEYNHARATMILEQMGLRGTALAFFKISLMSATETVPHAPRMLEETLDRLRRLMNTVISSPSDQILTGINDQPEALRQFYSNAPKDDNLSQQKWRSLLLAQFSDILSQMVKRTDVIEAIFDYYHDEYTLNNILEPVYTCLEFIQPEERCDFFIEMLTLLKVDTDTQRDRAIVLLIPMMPGVDHERYLMHVTLSFDQILSLLKEDFVGQYFLISHDIVYDSGLSSTDNNPFLSKIREFLRATQGPYAKTFFAQPRSFEEIKDQMLNYTVSQLEPVAFKIPVYAKILTVLDRYCPQGQAGLAIQLAMARPYANQLKLRLAEQLKPILMTAKADLFIDLLFGKGECYKMLLPQPASWWSLFDRSKTSELSDLNRACYSRFTNFKLKHLKFAFNLFNEKATMFMNLLAWVSAIPDTDYVTQDFFTKLVELLDVDDINVFEQFEKALAQWARKMSYETDQIKVLYQDVLNAIPQERRALFTGLKTNGDQHILEFLEQGEQPRVNKLKHASM